MIISHLHRFIFLRVPKTASTSVAIALSKFCGPNDVITEITREDEEIRRALGYPGPQNYQRKKWQYDLNDWKSFLFQRTRPLNYRHADAIQTRKFIGKKAWNSYFKFCVVRNPFDRVISVFYYELSKGGPSLKLNDFILHLDPKRLSTWERYTIGGNPAMEMICRFETLQTDLDIMSGRVGIPKLELPRAKTTFRKDHQHYSKLINAEARARIEEVCIDEINNFGYYWTEV
jgi:hypothetical protein